MRLRIIAFAAIGAISLVVMTSGANAQREQTRMRTCPDGGVCPAGTCNINGGPRACDVKNCKASNCRGQSTPGLVRPNEYRR